MLDTEPVITDLELVIVDVEMTDSAVVVELFLARRHSIRLVKKNQGLAVRRSRKK